MSEYTAKQVMEMYTNNDQRRTASHSQFMAECHRGDVTVEEVRLALDKHTKEIVLITHELTVITNRMRALVD